jgi:hypothetical protein
MNRKILSLLVVLLAVAGITLAAPLYKWVDEQGTVHYSDKPHPGATKLKLPEAQTYKAPDMSGMPSLPPPSQRAATNGVSFTISSPAPESTLWDAQTVTVSVSLSPGLQNGDAVTITLDGRTHGPGADLSATFDNLDPGEHTASAILKLGNGQTLTAGPNKFYILKHKIHKMIQ